MLENEIFVLDRTLIFTLIHSKVTSGRRKREIKFIILIIFSNKKAYNEQEHKVIYGLRNT